MGKHLQELLYDIKPTSNEPPENRAQCSDCGTVFRITDLIAYEEYESWEMPQVYTVHECPKCSPDAGMIEDYRYSRRPFWLDRLLNWFYRLKHGFLDSDECNVCSCCECGGVFRVSQCDFESTYEPHEFGGTGGVHMCPVCEYGGDISNYSYSRWTAIIEWLKSSFGK
jgi:hypothetical protein